MNIEAWWDPATALLAAHPILERLFFASIELAMLATLLAVFLRLFPIRSARLTSLLWLVLLVKPAVTLCFPPLAPVVQLHASAVVEARPVLASSVPDGVRPTAPNAAYTKPTPLLPEPDPLTAQPAPSVVSQRHPTPVPTSPNGPHSVAPVSESPPHHMPALPTFLLAAWITGIGLMLLVALVDRLRLTGMLRAAAPPPNEVAAWYHALTHEMGLRRPLRLLQTDRLNSPALAGVLRPTILLPDWLVSDGASPDLEWALRHELMHWKHCDPWANLLRQIVQTVFFFHPVAWLAGRKWEEATELACDRALVDSSDDARHYAESLYQLLTRLHARRRRYALGGLFATRTQVGKRIAALATAPFSSPARLGILSMLALIAFAALAFALGGKVVDGAVHEAVVEPSGQAYSGPFRPASWLTHEISERISLKIAFPGNADFPTRMLYLKDIRFYKKEGELRANINACETSWPRSAWQISVELYGDRDTLLADAKHTVENSGDIITVPLRSLPSYDFPIGAADLADKALWFRIAIEETPLSATSDTDVPPGSSLSSIIVTGHVTDTGGNLLEGVTVTALRTSGSMVFGIGHSVTNSDGHYMLDFPNHGGPGEGGWPAFPVQLAFIPSREGWFEQGRWRHASLYAAAAHLDEDNEWRIDPERVLVPRAEPYEIDFVMGNRALSSQEACTGPMGRRTASLCICAGSGGSQAGTPLLRSRRDAFDARPPLGTCG